MIRTVRPITTPCQQHEARSLRQREPAQFPTKRGARRGPAGSYFLLRRWTRVRRSSLRCFFLAIRLRRFLITEPINDPLSRGV